MFHVLFWMIIRAHSCSIQPTSLPPTPLLSRSSHGYLDNKKPLPIPKSLRPPSMDSLLCPSPSTTTTMDLTASSDDISLAVVAEPNSDLLPPQQALSKTARKKQLKQQRLEERKAARKSAEKERRKTDLERRRREWDEKLASVSEEERVRLVEERKTGRNERMAKRMEERELRVGRLARAKDVGQKIVIDLEFADLMAENEIHSLVHQIMFCYAVNGKCASPAHLWLTGCSGKIETQLQRLPGYDKWIIEKESGSYLDALQDQKENLVYLTADADVVLEELDLKSIYIVGGLVDRNRWKGITLKKAEEQGIRSARLPIGNYLKMSSSQVLTVNQVFEILLKFLDTRDWKTAFFQVIPLRKRHEADVENEAEHLQSTTELATVIEDFVDAEEEDEKEEINRNTEDEEIKLEEAQGEEGRQIKKKKTL